jgi:hypothetical protein
MVVRYVRSPSLREMIFSSSASLQNPLDFEKHLEKWATTPKIQALWLGN